MRPLRAAALAVLALLGVAGCGLGAGNTQTTTSASLKVTPPAPVPHHRRDTRRSAGAHRSPPPTPSPQLTRLRHAMQTAFKGQGARTGALVVNLPDGSPLYSLRAEVARAPASVEKIYTTVALLDLLGPDARLKTRVYGTGQLGKHGIWDGNLYLKGGGDPTFGDGYWNKMDEGGSGPTAAQIVKQLQARGIKGVTGHLYADASLFDSERGGPATNGLPDTPDYGGELSALVYDHGMTAKHLNPAAFAAHQLAATMKLDGIKSTPSRHTRKTPAGARLLATVSSPPMKTMVRLMDVPSDDLFADLFAKQLGARLFHQGTLTGGAIEIRQLLASRYRINPKLYDGSGLDKADRTSPTQVVSVLRQVYRTGTGRVLWNALPVVGREGTVQGIGVKTYASGHCVAKTGTLDNVTNLAGYCRARTGKPVAFALFVDGPSNWQALAGLSKAVAAIANY